MLALDPKDTLLLPVLLELLLIIELREGVEIVQTLWETRNVRLWTQLLLVGYLDVLARAHGETASGNSLRQ